MRLQRGGQLGVTYPGFFKNGEGHLCFRYRDGGSGDGSDFYNIYDPAAHSWRRLFDSPLFEGEGERSAYSSGPALGPDGYFHVLWMWRETLGPNRDLKPKAAPPPSEG